MRVVDIIDADGTLAIREHPRPSPGPKELLIQVAAAGINRPDLLQRKGLYPPPPGASKILGLEVSGRVLALGSEVKTFSIGDEVCALLPGGGYAEYAVAHEGSCLRKPQNLSLVEAATLPEVFFTVWSNLHDLAGIQAGERLLIHGGAGGIGLAAIQIGRLLGCQVFATARSKEKCQFLEALGAHCPPHPLEEFSKGLKPDHQSSGLDVILDIIGGDALSTHIDLLNPGGRLLLIGLLGGSRSELNLAEVLKKRLTIQGSTLRNRPNSQKTAIRDALLARVWPEIEAGRIQPFVDSVFPMEAAAEAHRRMKSSLHTGKIVLEINP